MPKKYPTETVLHDWVCELGFQMQALLLTAMRGPDENNKFNAAKALIRYLRGVVIKPASNWSGLNDNDFMWGDYSQFESYAETFWQDHDEYPHHFIMHLIHCAEVVGYKHSDKDIREYWLHFYYNACESFHMRMETEYEMNKRLSDFGCNRSLYALPNTKHTSTCLIKSLDDEPVFVLRAKDPTAPEIITTWCAKNYGIQPEEKLTGAMAIAQEMQEYRRANFLPNKVNAEEIPAGGFM